MRTLVLATLALVGCGPVTPVGARADAVNVRVQNDYAESIFWVSCELNGGTVTVFDGQRVRGYGSEETRAPLNLPHGATLPFTLRAQSLGEVQTFEPFAVTVDPDHGSTLIFRYRWDPATGGFSAGHTWGF